MFDAGWPTKARGSGFNEQAADGLLRSLYDWFADACEAAQRASGAFVRPGTGSAMFYLCSPADVATTWRLLSPLSGRRPTADGRRSATRGCLGANLAPTPGTSLRGPSSVLQSYAKIDYRRVCNGGPITMELSDSVFSDDESIGKVALLVRTFARLGASSSRSTR